MTLVITDLEKFHNACTTIDKKGNSLLDYASYNLQDSYYNKAISTIESKIDTVMETWKNNKINELDKQNQEVNLEDINSELKIHRMKLQKLLYKQDFENYFKDNIKEFEDLGLELTMGWVK